MEELEGKLIGVDVEGLMESLMRLESQINAFIQDDTIFHKDGCTYRVRKEGERFILTYKGKLIKKGNLKSRNEIEFEVSNPQAVIEFFEAIGIDTREPEVRKKKLLRFEVTGVKGELVFIENLPPTLELEGEEHKIKNACSALGVDFSKLQPLSWSDIIPITKDLD